MYLTDEQLAKIREIIKPLSKIVGDENQVLEAVKQALNNSDLPRGYTIIYVGRNLGKQQFANGVRDVLGRQGLIVIDDIDEPLKNATETADFYRENYAEWIKRYFPRYAGIDNLYSIAAKPETQKIKLGVKKRYKKAPKIQMLTGRQYFEFHFKVTDKLSKSMRQKKYPKRPTLKAENIFEAERRLQQQAKEISQISFTLNQQNTF